MWTNIYGFLIEENQFQLQGPPEQEWHCSETQVDAAQQCTCKHKSDPQMDFILFLSRLSIFRMHINDP